MSEDSQIQAQYPVGGGKIKHKTWNSGNSLGFIKWNFTWILFNTNEPLTTITWQAFLGEKIGHQSFGPFIKKAVHLSPCCNRTPTRSQPQHLKNTADQPWFSKSWYGGNRKSCLFDLSISQIFPSQNQSRRPSTMLLGLGGDSSQPFILFKVIPMCEINSKYARIKGSNLCSGEIKLQCPPVFTQEEQGLCLFWTLL